MLIVDFGDRLAAARKVRGLSRDEVGRRTGVRGVVVGRAARSRGPRTRRRLRQGPAYRRGLRVLIHRLTSNTL